MYMSADISLHTQCCVECYFRTIDMSQIHVKLVIRGSWL